MEALIIMLKNIILFVLLAVPGVILVKTKLLKSEQSGVLSKILLYVGMPFLIFNSTLGVSFDGELLTVVLLAAVIGIGYTFLWIFLSKPFTAIEKDEKTRGVMRFCSVFSNNGFLGLPLVMAVFPDKPLVLTFVVIVNIITNAVMYTVGVFMISGDKGSVSVKKAVFNPVLIAFALALCFNLLGVKTYVPEISTFAVYLGNLVTPLSMLILGMKLGDVKFSSMFTSWKTHYVSALKLIAMPVLAMALAFALGGLVSFRTDLVLGTFVAFGMPTAALATTFADGYGGDVENAVSFTLGTTVLSVLYIPILYAILSLLL